MSKKRKNILTIIALIILVILLFKGCKNSDSNASNIIVLKNTEKIDNNQYPKIDTVFVLIQDTMFIKEYIHEDKIVYRDIIKPIESVDTVFLEKNIGNPIYPIQIKGFPTLNHGGQITTPLINNRFFSEDIPFKRKILIGPSSNFNLNQFNYMGIDLLYINSEKSSIRLGLGTDLDKTGSRQPFVSWGYYYELDLD